MKTGTTTSTQITIEKLISTYRRYIHKVSQSLTTDNYIQQELVSVANISLWNAYQRFDKSQGEFHSYAISYIKGAMLNYLTDNTRTIKIPANKIHQLNREGEASYISTLSMDKEYEDDFNLGDTIAEQVEDKSLDDSQELVRALLKQYLSQLKEQWQKILSMRYIEDMTMIDIGKELNISTEAVRQQHDNAIAKLQQLFQVEQTNHTKFQRVTEQKRPNKK